MIDKEKAIRWFENIADECDKLTSGNVAHLKAQIKGMAIRSAEYLKKNERASEDFESEWKRYCDSKGGGVVTMNVKDVAKHFVEWQKEQFEKNRLANCDAQTEEEAEVESDFVMSIIENEHRQPTFDDAIKYGMRLQKEQIMKDAVDATALNSDYPTMLKLNTKLNNVNAMDEVKVIIIKE